MRMEEACMHPIKTQNSARTYARTVLSDPSPLRKTRARGMHGHHRVPEIELSLPACLEVSVQALKNVIGDVFKIECMPR
jgi:hypothetical protein